MGFVVADSLYYEAFISVWCFYAAVISIILYFILKDNEEDCAATIASGIDIGANAI
jgi:hypothetical protein